MPLEEDFRHEERKYPRSPDHVRIAALESGRHRPRPETTGNEGPGCDIAADHPGSMLVDPAVPDRSERHRRECEPHGRKRAGGETRSMLRVEGAEQSDGRRNGAPDDVRIAGGLVPPEPLAR